MNCRGVGGWLRSALSFVALAAAMAMAHAEPIGDRLAQAREEGVVVVYAAADLDVVKPVVEDFEALHPGVRVEYHDMQSAELYARVVDEARRGVVGAEDGRAGQGCAGQPHGSGHRPARALHPVCR